MRYYQAKGLTEDDFKDAVRLLDGWFSNNPGMRQERTDDYKALIGWPLKEVVKRKTEQQRFARERSYADAAELKVYQGAR